MSQRRTPVFSLALSLLLIGLVVGSVSLEATCGGGGGGGTGGLNSGGLDSEPRVYQVPWFVLRDGQVAPAESRLVLYWFPVSAEDARRSGLQNSRSLTLASARCVGMAIVPNDHATLRGKYAPDAKAQVVVLTDLQGNELGRLTDKEVTTGATEKLVSGVLKERDRSADGMLDRATASEKAGDKDAATASYREIYAERCLSPGTGKKAAKALKRLGEEISDLDLLDFPLPVDDAKTGEAVLAALLTGLDRENAGDFLAARSSYQRAHDLDPGDPVPLRYLGEAERHHTGDWQAASAWFRTILERPVDPQTRAVALHGLGKMTIHADRFNEGLALIVRSTEVYPLPLAYRNLAVYWNSEGQLEKARGYAEEAMRLAPEDPYNTIFLAVFLAEDGRREEALRIARQHQNLLEASYNLAVIHVLAGDKATGLALLKRHFHEYERFDAVRAKEMKEAREDIGFLDLRNDPAFVELTRLADDPALAWKGAARR